LLSSYVTNIIINISATIIMVPNIPIAIWSSIGISSPAACLGKETYGATCLGKETYGATCLCKETYGALGIKRPAG
jgi:hypothetical protein